MILSCREHDCLTLKHLLADHPQGTTVTRLAFLLGRSVRYVHSLVSKDRTFAVERDSKAVGNYWVRCRKDS